MKYLKMVLGIILVLCVGLFFYGVHGYYHATKNAAIYKERADNLILQNLGRNGLTKWQYHALIKVEDPTFETHHGVDFWSDGAGITTISQSLSKRLGFDEFKPGLAKVRQTGFAFGLEAKLSKDQIFALWLETLEMGRGADGWVTGFHQASKAFFSKETKALSEDEYLKLVAVLIAPADYDILSENDPLLLNRVARIKKLLGGVCKPEGLNDVWLKGCFIKP